MHVCSQAVKQSWNLSPSGGKGCQRIDHEGKIHLKPPFRIHQKAGIKPKLVPSIVFKEARVWGHQIEETIKSELSKEVQVIPRRESLQLDFWSDLSSL